MRESDLSPPELLSTGGLAARLGCSISGLKKWERLGVIPPAARVEGSDRRVWRVDDLAAIRERLEQRQAARQRDRVPAA